MYIFLLAWYEEINTYYRVDAAYLRGNEGKHLVKLAGIETLSEESANRWVRTTG
jgi:hypothetical protein